MRIQEAIAEFRQAAIAKAEFAQPAGRDHALHAAMSAAWRELEAHGDEGRRAFRSMLSDESPHVRCWVASQLLALGDYSGLEVLEESAASGGLRGLSSTSVLEEWRAGRLGPPLGNLGT